MRLLMKYRISIIAVFCLVCIINSVVDAHSGGSPCRPPCYHRVNGVCVSACECCNGQCCDGGCCDLKACFNPNAEHCCGEGTGKTCPYGKECCKGDCCDYSQCQYCYYNYGPQYCESRCGPCQECDGNGNCKVCSDDPTKCCVNGECKPKCIPHGGEMCQYTFPSNNLACTINNIDDPSCASEGTFCEWAVVGSPTNNDICQSGCLCELHSEACVSVYAKVCKNCLSIWYPFIDCCCGEPEGLVTEYQIGTRTVCGPAPF
jgi:hypothetical protein